MTEMPTALQTYLRMWNERDVARAHELLAEAVTDDIVFADPHDFHEGRAEMERNVERFRRRFPTATLSLASGVDGQNDRYRYAWEIHVDRELLIEGFDVSTLAADGRIERVDGFFGPLPALAE
ncbi:MAG: nuclear transport factor 2 family protein [Actinomycetota bacterium]